MREVIAAETVFTGEQVLSPGVVVIQGGRVADVSPHVPEGTHVRPGYLVPGFVDIHVHGGGGASVVGADQAQVETFARAHRRHGTTTTCASLVSAHPRQLLRDVAALAEMVDDGIIAGTHLEGPWIAPAMRGAHDAAALRPPQPSELDAVLAAARGTVHMVTLAPEIEHGLDAVRRLVDAGVIAALGHTAADWQQAQAAIEAGCTVATHLFNQMAAVHHRRPGPVPALLADERVHVELIADGIHVHPAVMAMVRGAIPAQRVVLVSDAMSAAGQSDGQYRLGEANVTVFDGVARLADGGALAGSTLTMDEAFRRSVRDGGFSVADAVQATSTTPARLLGRADIGRVVVGAWADLVALDTDLVLQSVWHRGDVVAGVGSRPQWG